MIRFHLLLFFLFGTLLWGAPTFPELTGRVVDQADLLTPQQEQTLSQLSKSIEDNSTVQLVVVTLTSLEGYDIAEYGYQLGRHWKIGQKYENNGILIIVAPAERKARIEVGYGLEGYLTDAQAHTLLMEVLLPRFKEKDFYGGLHNTTEEIRSLLLHEYQSGHRVKKEEPSSRWYWVAVAFLPFWLITLGRRNQSAKKHRHSRKRFFQSLLYGTVSGGLVWFFIHILLISGVIGVLVFLVTYFADRNTDFGSVLDAMGSSSGSTSGDSFDIFSGGGGSFGGGGASIDF